MAIYIKYIYSFHKLCSLKHEYKMKKKFGTNKGTGRRRERKCKCRKESSEVVESWESSEVEECLKCGKVEKRLKSEVESVLNVLHEAFVFQSHGACYSLNKNKRWQTFDNLPFKQKHNIYFQNNKILQLSGDENNSKTHKTVNFKVILEVRIQFYILFIKLINNISFKVK